MSDAIAAGIIGAAAAVGIIQCSIPAKARVGSNPKRTNCLPRAKRPAGLIALLRNDFQVFQSVQPVEPLPPCSGVLDIIGNAIGGKV
jgi:hypothetical protein